MTDNRIAAVSRTEFGKGAARRTVAEGGVSVNNVRVGSDEWAPGPADFLFGRWLVVRRGKRNIAGVQRVS